MQIQRTTMADAVFDRVRELIVSGDLPLGAPLRQDELAERLGVSRTPLREAIARLAAEGLVVSDPHRAAVVCQPSVDELRETYEIREVLEALAGRFAVERCTREHVDALSAVLDEFESAGSVDEWARLNTRFHMTMYAISGRKQLCKLIATMRNRAELFVRLLVTSHGRSRRAEADHREIVAALAAGNADDVELRIRSHLRATVESVTAVLESRKESSQ